MFSLCPRSSVETGGYEGHQEQKEEGDMTRTITFVIGIAVAVLAVTVPTALGEGKLAGSVNQDAVAYFHANELATLVGSNQDAAALFHANELATLVQQPVDAAARSAQPTSSGTEIDWPQIGIGFGIGILSVLGLILAVRLTRSRTLAHG